MLGLAIIIIIIIIIIIYFSIFSLCMQWTGTSFCSGQLPTNIYLEIQWKGTKIIYFNTVNFPMQLQADTENAHLSVQPEIFRQYYPEISENTYLSELHILSEKIPTNLPRIRRESLFIGKFLQISDERENYSPFSRRVVGDFPRTRCIVNVFRSSLCFLVV